MRLLSWSTHETDCLCRDEVLWRDQVYDVLAGYVNRVEEVYTNLCGYGGGCSVHNDALYGDEYRWGRCVQDRSKGLD